MRAVKLSLYFAGFVLAMVMVALLLAFNADLGRFKPQLEQLVTGLLERELKIEGPLHLTLDLQDGVELRATDVHLAATNWSAQPDLVSVGALELQLDLWSVFKSGPIMINQLRTDQLRVYLQTNADGAANWDFFPDADEVESEDPEQAFELPVLTEQVLLRDSVLSFDNPQRDKPLQLELSELAEVVAQSRQVSLSAKGNIRGEAVELTLGSDRLDDLVNLQDIDLALSGKLGQIDFTGNFSVADLLHPRRPTADLEVTGPGSEYLLKLLQLQQITSGPLDLSFTLAPGQGPMQFEMQGQFGEFTCQADGQFDDLSVLEEFAVQVSTQGPDLGRVAGVLGVPDLPHDRFALNGKVTRDSTGLALKGVTLEVHQSRLLLDATLPGFPGVDDAHATLRLDVPDISRFSALLGLPGEVRGPLDVDLDLTPLVAAQGAAMAVTATNSGLTLKASGNLQDTPDLVGSDLQIDLSGPGLGPITEAFALPQGPQIPFEFKAGLRRAQQGFALTNAGLVMADHQLSLQGMVGNAPLQDDTDIKLELRGDNLSVLLAAAGSGPNEVPQEPYQLSLAVKSSAGKIEVPNWTGTIGAAQEYQVVASALFDPVTKPVGSELKVKVHGPDISKLLRVVGMEGAPVAEFAIDTDIEGVNSGYRVNWFRGHLAREKVSVKGIVAADIFSRDTQLQFETSSPALKRALASYGIRLPQLPESKFKAKGQVSGNGKSVRVEQVVLNYVGARATLVGDLGEFPELDGSSVKLNLRGQNFHWLLPPETEFSGLARPFTMSADLGVRDKAITIDNGIFKLDDSTLTLQSQLGLKPLMGVGSFRLVLDSPNVTPLLAKNDVLTGPQVMPVYLDFGGHWKDELWTVETLDFKSGDGKLSGSGTLVGPPNISDSNLQLKGHLANLANFNALSPVALPALPTAVNVNVRGESDALKLDTLELSVGESQLSGNLTISDGHIPRIVGTLHASLLDMPALLPGEFTSPAPPPVSAQDKGRPGLIVPTKDKNQKVIPDTRIPMEILQRFTADVDLKVDELHLATQPKPVRNIGVELVVKNGGLGIEHFTVQGARGGDLEGTLGLRPAPGGPTLAGRVSGTNVSMGLPALTHDELEKLPRYDVKLAYSTQGDTVRSMAAALNGYLRMELGRGQIKSGAMQVFTNDFAAQLLDTLNPFSRKDPFTKVRCGVILATVEGGQITGSPALVFRTDRIDITADLKVDLGSEKLEATFTTAPRKGLGFSLSSLVNPYVMVIGTLANPVLSLDPEGVLVQGGVAVATGGLSIIARGIKARFFSAKDPCGKASLAANKDQQALERKYANDRAVD